MRYLSTHIIQLMSMVVTLVMLTACSNVAPLKFSHNPEALFIDEKMGAQPKLETIEDVFALTEAQKQAFLKKYHSPDFRDLSDSERIYAYLQDKLTHFNFHSDTLKATDALAQNSGNCLSLAILTKALAKLTHVGITYELARTPPVFQREGDFELSSRHIRTLVYNKNTRGTKQFVRPNNKIRIDYFSTVGTRTLRTVKKSEFYAMYYSNKAAEAMIDEQHQMAYWYLKEALNIHQENAVALNMLGVLYDKLGYQQLAENIYRYGLSVSDEQLELLNNYHHLLVKQNRDKEAAVIAKTLDEYDAPDPFRWLDLADAEMREGRYLRAIRYYEKASELADYLHQPYAGIARANFHLGRTQMAIQAIEAALAHSHSPGSTSIYQQKYDQLKSLEKTY